MKRTIQYTCLLLVLFLCVGGILYLMKDMLFSVFVDENFYVAKEYFAWLLLGFVFQSLYFLVTNFIFFKKRTKVLATITVAGALLNLILNYFFIQRYGVIGVAYATAVTWALFFAVVLVATTNIYKEK